jgi:hypothetical protein
MLLQWRWFPLHCWSIKGVDKIQGISGAVDYHSQYKTAIKLPLKDCIWQNFVCVCLVLIYISNFRYLQLN